MLSTRPALAMASFVAPTVDVADAAVAVFDLTVMSGDDDGIDAS